MRRFFLVALFIATPLAAHVGDINSVFDGMAGPYPIRVIVRPPGVVPGRAQITVRTAAPDVDRIAVKPVRWDALEAGSPPADVAQPVRGERGLYAAELWLMANGSHSIYVDVAGKRGSGRAIVPVTNMAVKRLPMPRVLGVLLAILGAILVLGAISIVGAGVAEATAATSSPRRARMAMVIAAVACVLLVARGQAWWNGVDARYRNRMFKPLHVTTAAAGGQLTLTIDDDRWQKQNGARGTPIIPDHGKMMHLFLIADGAQGDVAHLHPVALSRDRFRAALPPLAPGRYRLFADITHESGLAQTLLDTVTVGPSPSMPPSDPDDSWFSPAHPSPATLVFRPAEAGRYTAGRDADLRFEVRDAAGRPVAPEPYMGMAGHAIIAADDFSVFVHAHPNGTISMASQQKFLERDGVADHSMHDMHAGAATTIDFPYAFPKPGRYHLWVQAKVGGEVVTRRFDVTVS